MWFLRGGGEAYLDQLPGVIHSGFLLDLGHELLFDGVAVHLEGCRVELDCLAVWLFVEVQVNECATQ